MVKISKDLIFVVQGFKTVAPQIFFEILIRFWSIDFVYSFVAFLKVRLTHFNLK